MAAFCLHVRLLEATGAHLARARNLAGWYVRGVPEAAAWRRRAMAATTVAEYEAVASACVEACRAAGVEV
jgi:tRNA-dihydrouridine synthase